MRKSLFITAFFPPSLGGIQNYMWQVCKLLPKNKTVVLTMPEKNSQEFDKIQPFKIYRKDFYVSRFRPSWFPLVKIISGIINKEKIQLLQFSHLAPWCIVGLFFKKIKKIPYIIYLHGVDLFEPQKSQIKKKLALLVLKNASKIIANSEFLKNEVIKLGIKEKNIFVVNPGINYKKFIYSREKIENLRKKYNLFDKKIIFTLGRIIPRKGQDMVIKALPKVIKKIPNVIYLIGGDGEYKKELEKLVSKLNLERKVIFLGSISDVEDTKACYFYLSDVFAMPTREIKREKDVESFGIVYLEASACGKPVIGGRSGGAAEAVIDGKTGFLVKGANVDEIARAIIKLLLDEKQAKYLGDEGKKRAEKFDWKNQVKKLQEAIAEI